MSSILLAACLLFVHPNSESRLAGGGGVTGGTGVVGGVTGVVTGGATVVGGMVLLHAMQNETMINANRLFFMAVGWGR